MKNALIIHGMGSKDEYYSLEYPSASNSHWLPWLQKALISKDIFAVALEMPHNYEPRYDTWKQEFERFPISRDTILIGHSCGAGFIVRWLSEHKDVMVDKVVLVAPWLDPAREETADFFDFDIDKDLVSRTAGLTLFQSDNDPVPGVAESIKYLCEALEKVELKMLHNYGHFCFAHMKTVEFPELVSVIL
jgi:predicted alpha/beta hydrolase family esterase